MSLPLSALTLLSELEERALLKVIKGTHVRNGITGLSNKLQFTFVMGMVGDCVRYIKSHGWMISRVKTLQLGVDAHPTPI